MTAICTAAGKARQVSGSLLHDHIDGKHTPFLESKAFPELSLSVKCAGEPLGKAGHPRWLV